MRYPYRAGQYEQRKLERTMRPLGFNKQELTVSLNPRPDFDEAAWEDQKYCDRPTIAAPIYEETRTRVWARADICQRRWVYKGVVEYGTPPTALELQRQSSDTHLRELSLLSIAEQIEYAFFCPFHGACRNETEKTPHLGFFAKYWNAVWLWGCDNMPWRQLAVNHSALLAFDFGLPDFEVRYDFTPSGCESGYGELTNVHYPA